MVTTAMFIFVHFLYPNIVGYLKIEHEKARDIPNFCHFIGFKIHLIYNYISLIHSLIVFSTQVGIHISFVNFKKSSYKLVKIHTTGGILALICNNVLKITFMLLHDDTFYFNPILF